MRYLYYRRCGSCLDLQEMKWDNGREAYFDRHLYSREVGIGDGVSVLATLDLYLLGVFHDRC
jgi:hypothetical protein